jgi:hypothetical protein
MPWADMPKTMRDGLLESFVVNSKNLVSQQGSMAIYALGLMGFQLDTALPAVQDNIFAVSTLVLQESGVDKSREVNQQVG